MTVLPLVVSMLIAGVGGMASTRMLGRTGVRAVLVALALVAIAAAASAAIAQPILSRLQIDRSAAQTVQPPSAGVARSNPPEAPSRVAQWFIDLVPPNVVKAAGDDAMLPVIMFSVLFALALARVDDERRLPVLTVLEGIAEAMQRLVSAIIELAPIGVFALAVPLAGRFGTAMVGAAVA